MRICQTIHLWALPSAQLSHYIVSLLLTDSAPELSSRLRSCPCRWKVFVKDVWKPERTIIQQRLLYKRREAFHVVEEVYGISTIVLQGFLDATINNSAQKLADRLKDIWIITLTVIIPSAFIRQTLIYARPFSERLFIEYYIDDVG